MHGVNLWLDVIVDITMQLISSITRPLIQGEDMEWLLAKDSEKDLGQDLYMKYDFVRGERGILISNINDDSVKFFAQLMSCKLLRKWRKD